MSTTTITTSIELEALPDPVLPPPPPSHPQLSHRKTPFSSSNTSSSHTLNNRHDPILEASLAADSAAPDGGYGWVIVTGGAVLLWWSLGTTYAWGVLQAALLQQGEGPLATRTTPAILSFVGSLQAALVSVLALVSSRIMWWLGVRWTAVASVVVMGLSEILSSWAVGSVGGLFFCSGVLKGFGVSLAFTVVAFLPSQYFSKRRGLANGIMFAGSGFGGAANSFILDSLIQTLGIAWAYRILGILVLGTGLPAAWMMKPRTPMKYPGLVDWRLLKSLTFLLVFFGSAIGTFPLFVPPFFIPQYAKALGFSSSVGAGLVAGFSLSSAFGRIGSGWMSDKLGALNTVFASLVLTAVTMFAVWPASTNMPTLIVFVVVNGAANGAFFSTMPTVVSNVFGSARVSTAMSLVVTGWIGGYLMGAPIAGFILQAYGGENGGLQAYKPAMFYAGSLAVASGILILTARFRKNRAIFGKA